MGDFFMNNKLSDISESNEYKRIKNVYNTYYGSDLGFNTKSTKIIKKDDNKNINEYIN